MEDTTRANRRYQAFFFSVRPAFPCGQSLSSSFYGAKAPHKSLNLWGTSVHIE